MTVSFTFITSFRRLRLNSPPSVLYLTGILSWQSWKESICVAENIHSKECRSQKAALFHAFRNWNAIWLVSVIQKFNHHAIVNLLDDRHGLAETARILHYFPQAVFSHCIEGFGQINEGHKMVAILPLAFFLELACSEYHVGSSTFWAESTLIFWEESPLKMLNDAVQQNAGQDFASKRLAVAFFNCSYGLCWYLWAVVGPFLHST